MVCKCRHPQQLFTEKRTCSVLSAPRWGPCARGKRSKRHWQTSKRRLNSTWRNSLWWPIRRGPSLHLRGSRVLPRLENFSGEETVEILCNKFVWTLHEIASLAIFFRCSTSRAFFSRSIISSMSWLKVSPGLRSSDSSAQTVLADKIGQGRNQLIYFIKTKREP